jgi:excisionase family DNA binding protein
MKRYSVAEAAKELGVSGNTVYALCANRKLRHERHGLGRGRIKIPEDALEDYRRSVTVEAEAATTAPAPRAPGAFKNLDSARLLQAWREQGALPER